MTALSYSAFNLFMFPQLYSLALISGAVPLRNKSTPQAWAQALNVGVQAMMRYENWQKGRGTYPPFSVVASIGYISFIPVILLTLRCYAMRRVYIGPALRLTAELARYRDRGFNYWDWTDFPAS